MGLFVFACILIAAGVVSLIVLLRQAKRVKWLIGVAPALILLGLVLVATDSFYTQDTGEATVLVSWTGDIQGQETAPGLHPKAPWASVKTFNIRNQQVVFAGNRSGTDYTGGSALGPDIAVQDKDGVTSSIDIAVRYSIRPDQVTTIYRQFRDETTFVSSFITQDIRSTVRDAPNSFNTLDLITKRAEVNTAIQTALEARWKNTGVTVDSVSLQEIRPPKTVTDAYAAAQQAQIKVTTETANLQAAKVSAQQQVVQAQAKADANREIAKSLTANVLKQNYLDTLGTLAKAGNVVVVPEGFGGIIQVK